jgi:hypothetical protein
MNTHGSLLVLSITGPSGETIPAVTLRSKLIFAVALAVVAGGTFYYFRDSPEGVPTAAAGPVQGSPSPRAPDQPPPRRDAPVTEVRKVASSSDPFEYIHGLAKSAFDGDGRAQYLVGRELDKCEMTLMLVRKMPGDPEAVIWGMPDSWPQTLKERTIAEYRRCARLLKEDPFAELPARNGGYPFKYWKQRAVESGYPLAVTEHALERRPSADAAEALKMRAETIRDLTKATESGDPDVALTIGFRQSTFDDPVRTTTASAWMLAACRLGADCTPSSKVYPFYMCYDPDYPNCDKEGDVELRVSVSLGPERYADAYAQSQAIEEALRSRDPETIKPLLEKFIR